MDKEDGVRFLKCIVCGVLAVAGSAFLGTVGGRVGEAAANAVSHRGMAHIDQSRFRHRPVGSFSHTGRKIDPKYRMTQRLHTV